MMISSGADQMTSSSWVEWSQSGLYVASLFDARYFHAKKIVSPITGTMISSINTVDRTIKSPCWRATRSEEHTSELQSLMRISYAVFCLKKKKHYLINQKKLHKSTI